MIRARGLRATIASGIGLGVCLLSASALAVPDNIRGNPEALHRYFKNFSGTPGQYNDEWDELTKRERDAVNKLFDEDDREMNRRLREGPGPLPPGVATVPKETWERRAAAAFAALMDPEVLPGISMEAAFERNLAGLDVVYAQQHREEIALDEQRAKEQAAHLAQQREKRKRDVKEAVARATFRAEMLYRSHGLQVVDDLQGGLASHAALDEDLALIKSVRLAQLLQSLAVVQLLMVGDGSVPDGSFLGLSMGDGTRTLNDLKWRIARVKDALRLAEDGAPVNRSVADLKAELTRLEAQCQRLLALSGMPDTASLRAQRVAFLQTLVPAARLIKDKHDAFVAAQGRYQMLDQGLKLQHSQPGPYIPTEGSVTWSDVHEAKRAMEQARRELLAAFNGHAVLLADIDFSGFQGPFWQWLATFEGEQATALQAMNLALGGLADNVRGEIARVGDLRYRSELIGEFGSPLYGGLRGLVARQWQGVFPNVGLGMGGIAALYAALDEQEKLANQEVDAKIIAGQLGLALVTVIFPPLALVTLPLGLTLSAWQLGLDWERASQAEVRLEAGRSAVAAGGGVDGRTLYTLEQVLSAREFAMYMSAAGVGADALFFGVGVFDVLRAMRQAPGAADEVVGGLARTGDELGESLDTLIPAGARPSVAPTSNPGAIVDRIDTGLMARFPTISPVDDLAAFLRGAGLMPQQTVSLGGQTFHFSKPFLGPEGRLAVLVYQEAGGGGVLVRTAYLSNSHGLFRAVTGRVSGQVGKGAFHYVDDLGNPISFARAAELRMKGRPVYLPFHGESSADLAAELQAPLLRWAQSQPAVAFDDATVAERAFWGHVEDIDVWAPAVGRRVDAGQGVGEFGVHVGRSSGVGGLTPGMRPDLANPLDRQAITAGLYAGGELATFRSVDGSLIYTVIKHDRGLAVASIQDARSGIGPFATRFDGLDGGTWTRPLADYTDHIPNASAAQRAGNAWPSPAPGYSWNLEHGNDLTRYFASHWDGIGNPAFAGGLPWPGGTPRLAETLFDPGQTIFTHPNMLLPIPPGAGTDVPLILHLRPRVLGPSPGTSVPWGGLTLPGASLRSADNVIPMCTEDAAAAPLSTGDARIDGRCPGGADQVAYVFRLPQTEIAGLQALVRGHDDLLSLEPDPARGQQASDPLLRSRGSWGQPYDDQWAIKRVGFTPDSASAWRLARGGGQPIIVAVIDTGLAWRHEDLSADVLWTNDDEVPANGIDDDRNGYVDDVIGWNFLNDDNLPWDLVGHGTLVTGVIAAARDNGVGIAGVNPQVRIMVLKALDNVGQTRASTLTAAIFYAANNGARIINLSVGGKTLTRTEQLAIDYAHARGVLVVVAAGNGGTDVADFGPAGAARALTVAATGPDDRRSGFSNWGQSVALAAPGVDVLGLRAIGTDLMTGIPGLAYQPGTNVVGPGGRYYRASGTSFAAPLVAGTASLLWANDPTLTVDQVRRLLLHSARDIEAPGVDRHTGHGLLDATAALRADPEFFVDAAITGVAVVRKGRQVVLQIRGTSNADRFKNARIDLGRGDDPASWTTPVPRIGNPVVDGVLGEIEARHLAGATEWTLRVVTEHDNGKTRQARFRLNLR